MTNPIDYSYEYAKIYKFITKHKNYKDEVTSLKNFLISKSFDFNSTILSVGCGICLHENMLAEEGYKLIATDNSKAMLNLAKKESNKNISFFSSLKEIPKNCDATFAISLFNVVNCLNNIQELISFFKEINNSLLLGSGFFFESWNLYPCILEPPKNLEREFGNKNSQNYLIRKAFPKFDILNQKLTIKYIINGKFNDEEININSKHRLRIFSITEIEYALQEAGFSKPEIRSSLPGLNLLRNDLKTMSRMISFYTKK